MIGCLSITTNGREPEPFCELLLISACGLMKLMTQSKQDVGGRLSLVNSMHVIEDVPCSRTGKGETFQERHQERSRSEHSLQGSFDTRRSVLKDFWQKWATQEDRWLILFCMTCLLAPSLFS